MKFLLLSLLFITSLLANKIVYLSYEDLPQRVVKGEVFPITIKALSTVRNFDDITYKFSNHSGLKIINTSPIRTIHGKYYYEKFLFLITSSRSRLPDITAKVEAANIDTNETTTLIGQELNVITLNPKKNFSNIIADELKLIEFKTTSYDNKHNIIVFVTTAKNCNIAAMKFKNVFKQGVESITKSYFNSRITYYVVIKKELENFSFSYFNLKKNNFVKLNIPIIVDDDSVVAQSDLKPKDQSREQLKMNIAAAVAFVGFLVILWRKKFIYLFLIIIPLSYIIYLSIPEKNVCIKAGSAIQLLPVQNGTIFELSKSVYTLPKEGSAKGFVKVKLQNEKIGWVKNEDLCAH